VLFTREVLERIRRGEISLAFRRMRRPTVRPGGRLRTAAGILAIDGVSEADPAAITAQEARDAGYASAEALLEALPPPERGPLLKVRVRHAGADPRLAAAREPLDDAGLARVRDGLARLGRRQDGAEAEAVNIAILRLLEGARGTPARRLAAGLGMETAAFKRRVRGLKALALTESLSAGYALTPRGEDVLARLGGGTKRPDAAGDQDR